MRDYDALELATSRLRDTLQQIADGRPNKTFDPWARDLARAALAPSPGTPSEEKPA
jgi:hypothetical protein